MKKLLLLIFLLSAGVVRAQNYNAFSFLIGPSMDWYKVKNLAVINGVPSNQYASGIGYSAILGYEYQKNTYVGFGTQVEFQHTSGGIYRNYDINGEHKNFEDSLFTHTIAMNTINVPVFLKIRIFNGRYNVSYSYFHVGGGIQFLLNGNRSVVASNPGYVNIYPEQHGSLRFDNRTGTFLLGSFGRVMLTRRYIFLAELDYEAGLSNWSYEIYPEKSSGSGSDLFKRNSLGINLGIRLRNYHQPNCHEF